MSGTERSVLLSADAEDDLYAAWHFGAHEWSPDQADRHLRDIEEMFERLRENPSLGRKREDLIPSIRSAFVRPHLVFYRTRPKSIEIIRILHQRSDTQIYFRQ